MLGPVNQSSSMRDLVLVFGRSPRSARGFGDRNRTALIIVLTGGLVATACAPRSGVVAVRAERPQPTVVAAVPGMLDPTMPSVGTATVAGLPVSVGAVTGLGQSSLLDPLTLTFETAHVSQLVPTTGGLLVVGSNEVGGWTRRPTLWYLVRTEFGLEVAEQLALERRDDPDRPEAAAIDAIEMWDGSLRVLVREEDPASGSNVAVWSVSPERSVDIEHRFPSEQMDADARKILLDDAGRTWIVSASTKRDGVLDVAVDLTPDAPDGWVNRRVDGGTGRHVRAVTLGEDLFVFAVVGSTVASSRLVARRFTVVGDHIEVAELPLNPDIAAIQDVERVGDEIVMIAVDLEGMMSTRRTSDAVTWTLRDIPGRPGDVPVSVVDTEDGLVVLVSNPEDVSGRALDVRSLVLGANGFEPWAEPFIHIAWPTVGDFDFTAVAEGGNIVVADRVPDLGLSLRTVAPSGLHGRRVGISSWQPPFLERVDRLLAGPEGPVAIVARVAPIGLGNTWEPDGPNRVMQLSEGVWRTVGVAQVHGATMLRDRPILAVPSDGETTEWYTIENGVLERLGSTDQFQVVGEMVAVRDQLYATAQVGDDLHLFFGTVDGVMEPVDGLWGLHAAELCASDDRVYVIVESRVDTSRSIVEVVDGHMVEMIDTVPVRAEHAGAPPQCVARQDSLGMLYEFDAGEPFTALGAWWYEVGADDFTSVANSLPLRSGRVLATVSGDVTTEAVGLALDQWGMFDAVWWTVDEFGAPAERLVIGGPGIQEANSILRVADGYLIGGTDDGEPVVWLVPD